MGNEINTLNILKSFNRAYDRYVFKLDDQDNVSQLVVFYWITLVGEPTDINDGCRIDSLAGVQIEYRPQILVDYAFLL